MKGVFQWRSSSSKKCCRSATSAIQTRGAGSFSKVQMTQAQAEDTQTDWEAALVQRACTGDARAFERLYREHAGRVYGLCLRMTRDVHLAEDCTQETFINAWRALPRFQTRSSLSTWLHRIAVNVSLAKRRKASPVEASLEDEEGARDALVLHALYGYSHGEAAQMLGVAEGTCKAQLHRARKLLRERLNVEVS